MAACGKRRDWLQWLALAAATVPVQGRISTLRRVAALGPHSGKLHEYGGVCVQFFLLKSIFARKPRAVAVRFQNSVKLFSRSCKFMRLLLWRRVQIISS